MTDHKKIESILQEFCDSRELTFELKEKKAQMVITYTYEIIEKVGDLTVSYDYWFDVPDRGARIPKFTISVVSNNEYPTVEVQKSNLFTRIFNNSPFSTKPKSRIITSTETLIKNLLETVAKGKINVHSNRIQFTFNWFPTDSQHLNNLRETLLGLELQLTNKKGAIQHLV